MGLSLCLFLSIGYVYVALSFVFFFFFTFDQADLLHFYEFKFVSLFLYGFRVLHLAWEGLSYPGSQRVSPMGIFLNFSFFIQHCHRHL